MSRTPPEAASPIELQRDCNRASVDLWAPFADHRARVTALARAAGTGALAVLGAGNCNDLDLAVLRAHFTRIDLYDLDAEAVRQGCARQRADAIVHAPVDLSGALEALAEFRTRLPSPEEIARLLSSAVARVLAEIPDRFDVVLSPCLLTQLLHGAHVALGSDHPALTSLSCVLVMAHARVLAQLLRPGGIAVLITDVLSADEAALAEAFRRREPALLVDELERAHRCASGTGPRFLRRVLAEDAVIAPLIEPPAPVAPWLWRWSARRVYLVHAITFRARAGG